MRSVTGRLVTTPFALLLAALGASQTAQPSSAESDPAATAQAKTVHEYTLRSAAAVCSYKLERIEIRILDVGKSEVAELTALLEEIAAMKPASASEAAIRDRMRRGLAVPSPEPGRRPMGADGKPEPPRLTVEKRTMSVLHAGALEVARSIDPTADIAAAITEGSRHLTWSRSGDQVNYWPERKPSRSNFGIASLLAPLPSDEAGVRFGSSLEWRSATDEQTGVRVLMGTGANHKREVWLDRRGLPIRMETWSGPQDKPAVRELGMFVHAAVDASKEVVNPGDAQQRPAMFMVACAHFVWLRNRLQFECSRLTDISFAAPAKEDLAIAVPASIKILVTREGQLSQMFHAGNQASWPDFLKEHLRLQR